MTKRCFYCGWLLPLFMFARNRRKYQNSTNLGRNYSCRICNYKRWKKTKSAWLWDNDKGKFEKVTFKNAIDVIKRTWKN